MSLVDKILKEYKQTLKEDKTINFKRPLGNFVVMIGGSGSGKSYIAKNKFSLTNFKILNPDTFKHFFSKKLGIPVTSPESASLLHQIAERPSAQFISNVIGTKTKANDNILFDTTGRKFDQVKTFVDIMSAVGYVTTLVYVKVDMELAAKRNKERGKKGEHVVPEDVLIAIHQQVNDNFEKYCDLFDNVFIVNNVEGADFSTGEYIRKIK